MELRKKKQKSVAEKFFPNAEPGDAYSYLALKRETGLFAAFAVGKWIEGTCEELYELIAKRTQQPTYYSRICFCTDGNDQNLNAIPKSFNKDCVNYGQVIKDRVMQKVIGSHVRKVFGNLAYSEIYISNIDGFCSALRERLKFAVRRAKTFVKRRNTISEMLAIYQAYHNLIKAESGATPCMLEGITSDVWSWSYLFHQRLPYV